MHGLRLFNVPSDESLLEALFETLSVEFNPEGDSWVAYSYGGTEYRVRLAANVSGVYELSVKHDPGHPNFAKEQEFRGPWSEFEPILANALKHRWNSVLVESLPG